MAATIYLIRHGETTWNRAGRLQGQADSPLTLKGTRQIEAVADTLRNLLKNQNYVFWASPIGRTQQSASIICDIIGTYSFAVCRAFWLALGCSWRPVARFKSIHGVLFGACVDFTST